MKSPFNIVRHDKLYIIILCCATLTACGHSKKDEPAKTQSFKVTTAITGTGTVTPSQQNIERGKTTSLTINPAEGQQLVSAVGCSGTLKDMVYTTGAIQADCQVDVKFAAIQYQVSSKITGDGTVNPATQQIEHGKVATFTLGANDGHQIESVAGCDGTLNGNTYTTAVIKNNCQIDVKFIAINQTLVPVQRIVMDQPSITALNGELIGNVSFITGKNGGKAAKFGGVDNPSAIRIPNRESLKFDQEFTFDLWARIDSKKGMNGYGRVVEDEGVNTDGTNLVHSMFLAKANDDNGWGLRTQNSGAYHHTPQNSNDPSWIPNKEKCTPNLALPKIPIGTWYRVTFVASKTSGLRAYANKQLILECKDVKPSFDRMNPQDLYIGKNSRTDFAYPLNGAIQDIDVYNTALTDEQVQALPEPNIPEPSQKIVMEQSAITALNGQLIGNVTFIAGKDGGKAAKFGGVDNPSAIHIPNRDSLKFDQEFTFDLWARIDSKKGMNGYGRVVEDEGVNTDGTNLVHSMFLAKANDDNGWGLRTQNSGAYHHTPQNSNDPSWIPNKEKCTPNLALPKIPIGTWYRVTFVASKTSGLRAYANKQLILECKDVKPSFDRMNPQDLYIGKNNRTAFAYPLNGAIQDINFYKTALSDAQVQALP